MRAYTLQDRSQPELVGIQGGELNESVQSVTSKQLSATAANIDQARLPVICVPSSLEAKMLRNLSRSNLRTDLRV